MKLFLSLLLFISSYLTAQVSYWDEQMVRSYVHHSDLQRRWAWSFLAPHLKTVAPDAQILDMGCGDGKITADIAKFIPQGSVVGIDLSYSMVEWAKKQYHPLEYPNLSFKQGSFLETGLWAQFDLIVSFCALQHCKDPKKALDEMTKRLKAHGKLLILVPEMKNDAWNQARLTTQTAPKWASYWEGFPPRTFLDAQQYEALFKETTLHLVKIERIPTMDPFIDQDEILDWLEGTFPPVVPKDQVRDFYRDWIEEYLRLDPQAIDEDGTIYARFGLLTLEAVLNPINHKT